MAARKIAAKEAGGAGGMTAEQKCMTMMRPNELLSMDEDMVSGLLDPDAPTHHDRLSGRVPAQLL